MKTAPPQNFAEYLLGQSNNWRELQTFGNNISIGGAQLDIGKYAALSTTQMLAYDGANWFNQDIDSTLDIHGSTPALGINLGNPNTWTAEQTIDVETAGAALLTLKGGTAPSVLNTVFPSGPDSWFANALNGDIAFRNGNNYRIGWGFSGASGQQDYSLLLTYPYTVSTKNNTLDDGLGKPTFTGLATFNAGIAGGHSGMLTGDGVNTATGTAGANGIVMFVIGTNIVNIYDDTITSNVGTVYYMNQSFDSALALTSIHFGFSTNSGAHGDVTALGLFYIMVVGLTPGQSVTVTNSSADFSYGYWVGY